MESIPTIKHAYIEFIEYLNTLKTNSKSVRKVDIGSITIEDTKNGRYEKKTMQEWTTVLDNISTTKLRLLEICLTNKTATKVKSSKAKQ